MMQGRVALQRLRLWSFAKLSRPQEREYCIVMKSVDQRGCQHARQLGVAASKLHGAAPPSQKKEVVRIGAETTIGGFNRTENS